MADMMIIVQVGLNDKNLLVVPVAIFFHVHNVCLIININNYK